MQSLISNQNVQQQEVNQNATQNQQQVNNKLYSVRQSNYVFPQHIQQQVVVHSSVPPTGNLINQQEIVAQNCIRKGCTNPAISAIEWEDEYCSNECCVSHSKNIFKDYFKQNIQQNFSVAS